VSYTCVPLFVLRLTIARLIAQLEVGQERCNEIEESLRALGGGGGSEQSQGGSTATQNGMQEQGQGSIGSQESVH
jgi:hypothetical protein